MKCSDMTVTRMRMVATLAACLAVAAQADTIQLGGLPMSDVRITNIADGKIEYFAGGARRSVELDRVTAIELSAHPDYAAAVAKIDSEPRAAADQLRDVLDEVDQKFLKPLVRIQLSRALDKAGKYADAFEQYFQVIQADASAWYLGQAPTNYPKDDQARAAAAKLVRQASADTRDRGARAVLNDLLADLEGGAAGGDDPRRAAADPPVAADDQPEAAAPTPAPADVEVRQAANIGALMRVERFDQALEMVNQAIDNPDLPGREKVLPDLYFQRGQVEAKLNRPLQAAGSFLRVAVHFPDHDLAIPALESAGAMFAAADRHAAAGQTYKAAIQRTTDRTARQRIQQALDRLPQP